MSRTTIEDVIEATRIVNKLDKRGKLAILRDLQKQGLEPKANTAVSGVKVGTGTSAKVPVTYTEGGEK